MWPWSTYPTFPIHAVASLEASNPKDATAFDYIVVGGGTGGCVLASRLSEDLGVSVLLLERGEVVNTWASKVPLLSCDYRPAGSPAYKWNATSLDPLGMISGKAMGGTSKINAFLYCRSLPAEYNAWAKAGRKNWSWEDVLPYFIKSESSLSHGSRPWRGNKGPWQNQMLPEMAFDSVKTCMEACAALGIPYTEEANVPDAPPVSAVRVDMTIDENMRRNSTFDAFLPQNVAALRSSRFKICTGAVVSSLDIQASGEKSKVQGLWLKPDEGSEQRYYVRARREVILCSGAIGSPQLLLLSGIGPADHLQERGIKVVKDIPAVGTNLQDHPRCPVIFRVPIHDSLHNLERSPFFALKELLKYVFLGKGVFLSPNPQATIFACSRLLDDDFHTIDKNPADLDPYDPRNLPDIEIMPTGYTAAEEPCDLKGDGAFTLLVAILRPRSAGLLRLNSNDPRDRPACDLSILQHPDDMRVMRLGIRLALRIARQMREMGYPLKDAARAPDSESDEDIDRYIRKHARSTFHYSSTCRMAPEEDWGVVDDELRVHGVENLRIADASIFPTIPATHLQAPVVMVAERCADFVRNSNKAEE